MRQRLPDFPGISGPVVIIVMDGYGLPKSDLGSALAAAREAVVRRREHHPGTVDQDLPPLAIADPRKPGQPPGPIVDSDSVVFCNFRGDRAIEITRAAEEAAFDSFDRVRAPKANLFLMRLELGLRRQLGQLVDVVNRGGDADTTGAIASMLAGALYGPQAIPKRWLKALNPGVASRCRAQARALLPFTA